MTIGKNMFYFLSLCLLAAPAVAEPIKYVLSEYCNATIPVESAALLRVDNWFMQDAASECRVTIKSDRSIYNGNLVRLQILHFDVNCYSNTLVLYDGQVRTGRQMGSLCGGVSPEQERYLTVRKELTVVLTKQQYAENPVSISMLATSTSREYSGGDDFTCDNGLMISNSLICDGYNNCGDRSDEEDSLCRRHDGFRWTFRHTCMVVGAGVGGLLLIVLVVVVIAVKKNRSRQRSKKTLTKLDAGEANQAYGSIQA